MSELDARLLEVSDEEFIEYAVNALKSDAFSCIFVDREGKRVVMHKIPGQKGRVWSWIKLVEDSIKVSRILYK